MLTADTQITNVNKVICDNIAKSASDRELLSMNILSQVRNLVEAIAVRRYTGRGAAEMEYKTIQAAMKHARAHADSRYIAKFHTLLQRSVSHYTHDGAQSERLMIRYYEYLFKLREAVRKEANIHILDNLEQFPLDLDKSHADYYAAIAARIRAVSSAAGHERRRDRYYIHKIRPFFVGDGVYYEMTVYSALDRVSKYDRLTAFTHHDVSAQYACYLTMETVWLETLGYEVPITVVADWEPAVRPCEFENLGRILGLLTHVQSGTQEYKSVMKYLGGTGDTLVDLVELEDEEYEELRALALEHARAPQIFAVLDSARALIKAQKPGCNTVRYLLHTMRNQVIKSQYNATPCNILSNLRLKRGCNPFEQMPLCTSLVNHNPRLHDLLEIFEVAGRDHELLARRLQRNVDDRGMLYTPVAELSDADDLDASIASFNAKLYRNHGHRRIEKDRGHVFIGGHEDDTAEIIRILQLGAAQGIDGYSEAISRWLETAPIAIDDPAKEHAMKHLYSRSRVALIYGAAGTGKSTMVNYVSAYFSDRTKLFLAQTNPAVDNLRGRVMASNSTFRTIASHTGRRTADHTYDLLVVDECSTVSNADLIRVMQTTKFRLLLLVGDIHQIEAIQFGNWFNSVRSFLPSTSVFELAKPYRTDDEGLLRLWNKVRKLEPDIPEELASGNYSSKLDSSLFQSAMDDEIILCMNYDGLYGINNINRLMQSANPELGVEWNHSRYKINDPVLFNEVDRFKPLIYNNLKGRIVRIHVMPDGRSIWFDVSLDRGVTAFDVEGLDLTWVEGSVVRFEVHAHGNGDRDEENSSTVVPFQVAYAVSVHKAQGLEYGSVKLVVTHDNEDRVSHNIFYTAITRARKMLKIYWTPETQNKVLSSLELRSHRRDVDLLASRRGFSRFRAV